nr:redox-sensing transcriptional repressor Rex [Maliibacterium massiliense]
MNVKGISKSTLRRLPIYLTYLKSLPAKGPANISATAIAAALKMGEVQVRKDLASVSASGKPRIGYIIADLIAELEAFLGYHDVDEAVVVGAGKLGKALLDYGGFSEYGLRIVAGFDIDAAKQGQTGVGKQIFDISKLENLCRRMHIKIGIITVPAERAQSVCDTLVQSGIQAILNFAPTHLVVPPDILVQNENIAASLAVLANNLKEHAQQINQA